MAVCPNCKVEVTGTFCPLCGMNVAMAGQSAQQPMAQQQQPMQQQPMTQPPTQQPYYPAPGAPPARYGPPVGERIGRSPVAKIGIAVMIIAILGLILALAIPWIIVEEEVDGYVCQNCGHSDTDYFYICPDCGSWNIESEPMGKESFSFNFDLDLVDGDEDHWSSGDKFTNNDEMEDYMKGSIGLAFIGFIFAMILAIILIVIIVMAYTSRYPRGVFHGLGVIIGALILFSGVMIIISGMNFLGFDIVELHTDITTEDLGGEDTSSTIFPAAYIILIFGIIILLISIIIIKREFSSITPSQPTRPAIPPQQPLSPQYPGGDY